MLWEQGGFLPDSGQDRKRLSPRTRPNKGQAGSAARLRGTGAPESGSPGALPPRLVLGHTWTPAPCSASGRLRLYLPCCCLWSPGRGQSLAGNFHSLLLASEPSPRQRSAPPGQGCSTERTGSWRRAASGVQLASQCEGAAPPPEGRLRGCRCACRAPVTGLEAAAASDTAQAGWAVPPPRPLLGCPRLR